jgi:hypothetical protein
MLADFGLTVGDLEISKIVKKATEHKEDNFFAVRGKLPKRPKKGEKWIKKLQDNDGRYKPTSIFMKYKGWDFANKKEASPWITYLCCKILKQFYR